MPLEDILKAQGYTDADIAAASTFLADPKFRGAVEKHITTLESDLGQFRTENNNWADWAEKVANPQIDTLKRTNVDLQAQHGSLEARLKALDPTYKPGAPPPPPERTPAGVSEGFDPKQFVTQDQANTFLEATRSAIAMATNLAEEYRELTGTSMYHYTATLNDGRVLRGMPALQHEAVSAKQALPDYIEKKFDFAGKRASAAEKSRQAGEEAIRKDERTKVMAEYGNPNTRPGMPSTQPFVPVRPKGDGAKQPWEIPAGERKNQRVQRALEAEAQARNAA